MGQALFGNKYSDLENAENINLSSSGKKINNRLTFLEIGGKSNVSKNDQLAWLAAIKFSNNFSDSLHLHYIIK